MPENATQSETKNQKRKADSTSVTKIHLEHTVRDFPFYYLEISLVVEPPLSKSNEIDALTAKKYLTAATTQRFGVFGSAVSIDILKLDSNSVWIRVPYEDRTSITEALSGWDGNGVAWQIRQSGPWLGGLTCVQSRNLFDD